MATARLNRPTISNRISSIKRAITRAKLSLSYFISPFFHFSLFLFPSIESGLVVFTPSGIVFTRVQWCTCVRIFMKNIWKFRIVPAEQADGKGESAEADREQKPLWDRKSARVDSYHPLEVVRERRPDGSHGSITSRAPTFFHSHRNGCGGLSRGGGSAPKTRKYSFNGDDRLSPQLKLIFFFFFFFHVNDVSLARMASIHRIEYRKRGADGKVEITFFFFPNSFDTPFLCSFDSRAWWWRIWKKKKKNGKSVRKRRHARLIDRSIARRIICFPWLLLKFVTSFHVDGDACAFMREISQVLI